MAARKPTGRAKRHPNQGLERWFPMLDMGLLVLGIASVLSFGYLMWVILGGGLAHSLIGGTQLEVIKSGLMSGQKALLYSLWLLLLIGLVRHYRTETVGYLAVVGGALSWFGMPLVIARFSPPTAAELLQQAARDLMTGFEVSGAAMLVVGAMRVIVGRIILMAYQPKGATATRLGGPPEPVVGGRHSLMRKCWELHFCRGSVRTTCPRYLEGTSCWRRRSGCYCDHDLAGRLMASVGGNASIKMQVAEELETQQRRAQAIQMRAPRHARGAQAARRLCRECPIYLEHQKHKYRALSWLAYPATAIIIALTVQYIRNGYEWSDEHAAKFVSQYNFIPQHLMDHPVQVAPWLNAENFAIGIVAVVVLALLLRVTEAAVFKLKL